MSPHVGNFVQDLVEMAKAMEELPKVREALDIEKGMSDQKSERIQTLELRVIDLKNALDEKTALIRNLEASRDDAELRFLELDERAAKAVRFLAQVQGMATQAELELNPPKPEPMPEPISPQPEAASGQSESLPTAESVAQTTGTTMETGSASDHMPWPEQTHSPITRDQSPGEFSGKRYIDIPGFVPLSRWLDGGGTEHDYYYRGSKPSDDGTSA